MIDSLIEKWTFNMEPASVVGESVTKHIPAYKSQNFPPNFDQKVGMVTYMRVFTRHMGSHFPSAPLAANRAVVSTHTQLIALRWVDDACCRPCSHRPKLASSTSPQKPPTTYTRVNYFRHRDSLFRGRLIRGSDLYVSMYGNQLSYSYDCK